MTTGTEQVLADAEPGEAGRSVDLDQEQLTELLTAYGIELWPAVPVDGLSHASATAEALGWDVVLKATADHLRQHPDLVSHVTVQ